MVRKNFVSAFRLLFGAGFVLVASGCANLAGIDSAKNLTDKLSGNLKAASLEQKERASTIRQRARALETGRVLALADLETVDEDKKTVDEDKKIDAVFKDTMCVGYPSYDALLYRTTILDSTDQAITDITSPSPSSFLGLVDSLTSDNSPPARPILDDKKDQEDQEDKKSKLFLRCEKDMSEFLYVYNADGFGQFEFDGGTTAALLSVFEVVQNVIWPPIKAGLTKFDRLKRLEDLSKWANDSNGLPYLRLELQKARERAAEYSNIEKKLIVYQAYAAWESVKEQYKARNIQPCGSVTGPDSEKYYTLDCVEEMKVKLKPELDKFWAAAKKYDDAFDADPTKALQSTERTIVALQEFLAGDLTDAQAVTLQIATIESLQEWLSVFEGLAALETDETKKKKISDTIESFAKLLD